MLGLDPGIYLNGKRPGEARPLHGVCARDVDPNLNVEARKQSPKVSERNLIIVLSESICLFCFEKLASGLDVSA